MELITFLRSGDGSVNQPRLKSVARKAGTTAKYLYLIALGHKRAGPVLAISIEKATGGEVSRADLRSDLWPSRAA